MNQPYPVGRALPSSAPGKWRPRGAWLAAGAVAVMLAACGGGDDAGSGSAQSGTLYIANADTTLAACEVDGVGAVLECHREFPANVQISGNVAVQSGYAYVTDLYAHQLAVCALEGSQVSDACVNHDAQGLLSSPAGLAATETALFVANDDGGLVGCELSAPGQIGDCHDAAPDGAFVDPMDLAVHDGRLYVTVQGSNRIDHCAIGAGATLSDCRAESAAGLLNHPTGLAASDGRLYITNPGADTLVSCGFGDGGRLQDCRSSADPDPLENPLDIAVNGDMVYVANPGLQGIAVCHADTSNRIRNCQALVAGGAFFLPTGMTFVPATR